VRYRSLEVGFVMGRRGAKTRLTSFASWLVALSVAFAVETFPARPSGGVIAGGELVEAGATALAGQAKGLLAGSQRSLAMPLGYSEPLLSLLLSEL